MECEIIWQNFSKEAWGDLLNKCQNVNLLQSYYYAQAMREAKQQGIRHGLIKIDGVDAGIVQMQEVSLFRKLIHAISIDRGPLWFKKFGKEDHLNAFADTLNNEFTSRFLRKRRLMPEFLSKNHVISLENWKKDKKQRDYCTFIVDLSQNLDEIRKKLKKNWRNHLNKAEKQNLLVEVDYNLDSLSVLLGNYMQDRIQRRYAGASPKFLTVLAKHAAMDNNCIILNAVEDDEVIASIMIFVHGLGATYQIGWTTPYGRDKQAHYLLLWRAIELLKQRDITSFDLGGYNDDTDGIRKFKQGLGGHAIALIGSYS